MNASPSSAHRPRRGRPAHPGRDAGRPAARAAALPRGRRAPRPRAGGGDAALHAACSTRGAIRRIGAVPNHYALGYRANGMTVWDVDDAHVDELGEQVGALAFVSALLPPAAACCRDWPYNLFAMVHGATPRRGGERRSATIAAAARRRRARARHPVQHRDPEEDRPAPRRWSEIRCSASPSSCARLERRRRPRGAAARSARPGRDLESDPALQPHLQALLLDLGRHRLPRRAVDRRGLRGDGRPARRSGVPVLILSGGEPLLRPDIFEIAARAKAMGFYVGLSTNGTLIDAAASSTASPASASTTSASASTAGARRTTRSAGRRARSTQSLAGVRAAAATPASRSACASP